MGWARSRFSKSSGWLIGFEGRVDGYRPLQSGDPQTALQLAILTGKRLYLVGSRSTSPPAPASP